MTRSVLAVILTFAASPVFAEGELTYRARVQFEGTAIQANASRSVAPRAAGWNAASLFVGAADSTYDAGARVRLGGGLRFTGTNDGDARVAAREAYGRVSVASWLDVEAGKRLLRWGVGYGFAPTGVLDPPRAAADPTDRLGLNEGLVLARADLYRGDTTLSVAAAAPRVWRDFSRKTPERIAAARLRAVVGNGFEVALIGAASSGERPSLGGNITHVIGQQLEWHGELVIHDEPSAAAGGHRPSGEPDAGRDRTFSAVGGLQYTFAAGVNLVLEYHRNGRGLDDRSWEAVMRGERDPGPAPARRQFMFVRGARAGADRTLAPEIIVIAGLDDGAWTFVPALTWTLHQRLQLLVRGVRLFGGRQSIAGLAPWSTSVTVGAAARF